MKEEDIKFVDTLRTRVEKAIDKKYDVEDPYTPRVKFNGATVGVVGEEYIRVCRRSFMDDAKKLASELNIKRIERDFRE